MNFNGRTSTLFYKNISHTLFSKQLKLVMCERWAGDGDKLPYWPSSTSFSSWLGCSTVGHWGSKALCPSLALNSASCLQLSQVVSELFILLFNVHLLPLFFRLFTQVHLLINDSVEGQYVTLMFWLRLFFTSRKDFVLLFSKLFTQFKKILNLGLGFLFIHYLFSPTHAHTHTRIYIYRKFLR